MLGRKGFSAPEIANGRQMVEAQLAITPPAGSEALFYNTAALALDRRYVHRVRAVAGKGGTPLNELELVADALIQRGGVFETGTVIKHVPADSITGLADGDTVALSRETFERLAIGCLAELEEKFREPA